MKLIATILILVALALSAQFLLSPFSQPRTVGQNCRIIESSGFSNGLCESRSDRHFVRALRAETR